LPPLPFSARNAIVLTYAAIALATPSGFEILKFLEDVYSKLDPYISKYEKYLGAISHRD